MLRTGNGGYPLHFVLERWRKDRAGGSAIVPRGDGKVRRLDGKPVAVHRRESGTVSAVCAHPGCLVRWNNAEHTGHCPWHGSRFSPQGLVLGGPAEAPLEPIPLAH